VLSEKRVETLCQTVHIIPRMHTASTNVYRDVFPELKQPGYKFCIHLHRYHTQVVQPPPSGTLFKVSCHIYLVLCLTLRGAPQGAGALARAKKNGRFWRYDFCTKSFTTSPSGVCFVKSNEGVAEHSKSERGEGN
jgi:hypothetical protein